MDQRHAQEILQRGRTVILIPFSTNLAQEIAGHFQRFLKEVSEDERARWSFNGEGNEDPDGSPDDGYIPRKGEMKGDGDRYDEKDIFHFRPRLLDFLKQNDVNYEPWRPWLNKCLTLYRLCFGKEAELLLDIDRLKPGYDCLRQFVDLEADQLHVLRIVQYVPHGSVDDNTVGKKHLDRNFLTFQIAESRPGLRYFPDGSDDPVVYKAQHDHVLAFPGRKFAKNTGGEVPALAHDIVNVGECDPTTGRWSVIFFGHIVEPLEETAHVAAAASAAVAAAGQF
ncbi:MAG TPA: hypothetical protein VMT99_01445 [Candidatus Paceibacterota bacterium]|nr:hypothetical protein [Candidatus Paceibacterota bacterium]